MAPAPPRPTRLLRCAALLALGLLLGTAGALDIYVPDVERETCEFGSVMAADGDYVIVGSSGNTANITYVYQLAQDESGAQLVNMAGLHDDKYFYDVLFTQVNDYQSYLFGKSVDILGDLAVVGAPGSYVFSDGYYQEDDEDSGTSHNVANPNYVQNAGIVFVYERNYNFNSQGNTEPIFRGKFYLTKGAELAEDDRFGNYVKLFNDHILLVGVKKGDLYVYDINDQNVAKLENNRFLYDKLLTQDDGVERHPYMEPLGIISCPLEEKCTNFGQETVFVMGDYLFIGDSGYKVSDERSTGGIFVFKYEETGFVYQHVIVNGMDSSTDSGFGNSFSIQKSSNGYDLIVGASGTELFMGSETDAGAVYFFELDESFKPYSAYQRNVKGEKSEVTTRFIVNVTPDAIYPPYPTKGDIFGENISMINYKDSTIVAVSSSRKKTLDSKKGIVSLYKLVESNYDINGTGKKFELLFTITESTGYDQDLINNHPEYPPVVSNVGYASSLLFFNNSLLVGATNFQYNIPYIDDEGEVSYKLIKNGGVYLYDLDALLYDVTVPELLLPISYYEKEINYKVYLLFKDFNGNYIDSTRFSSLTAPTIQLQCGTTSYKPPTLYFSSTQTGDAKISIKANNDESTEINSSAFIYDIIINGIQGMVCSFEISGVAYGSSSYYDYTIYVGDNIHSQTIDGIEINPTTSSSAANNSMDNILISSNNSNNINTVLDSRFTSESYILQYSTINPIDSLRFYVDPNNFKEDVDFSKDILYVSPIPLYYKELGIVFALNMESQRTKCESMNKRYGIYSFVLPETQMESKYIVFNNEGNNQKVNDIVQTFDYLNMIQTSKSGLNINPDNFIDSEFVVNNRIISDYGYGSFITNDGPMYVIGTDTGKETLLLTKIDKEQEYICDLMEGIRTYDINNKSTVLRTYGVNGTNNIKVMNDLGVVIVGAKNANAVYFLDFQCSVLNGGKVERPDNRSITIDDIDTYDFSTENTHDYINAKMTYTFPGNSFGGSVNLIPLSEIERKGSFSASDYILFVGAPGDISLNIENLIDDINNLRLSVSEILNLICIGRVYMLSVNIDISSGSPIFKYSDGESSKIRVIPCSTDNGDLSFGDKVEVVYRDIMISSTMKVNRESSSDSEDNTIAVTIGSTTYYIPVADGAIETFILKSISFSNEMKTTSSELTYLKDSNLLSSFGLRSDLAKFGNHLELIPISNETSKTKFLLFVSASEASVNYSRQGAVITCDGTIADIEAYDDSTAPTSSGSIHFYNSEYPYALDFECNGMLMSKKRCTACNYGSAMRKSCDATSNTCFLVVGENENDSYTANKKSGAAHFYKVTYDSTSYNIDTLGTKISTYANANEKFGTGVGINIIGTGPDGNIQFVSVIGSPGSTTSFGYNSGLVTVLRNTNKSYSVKVIGNNGREIKSGAIGTMGTLWEGAKYTILVSLYDVFGNYNKPEEVVFDSKCYDMPSQKEVTGYNIRISLIEEKNQDPEIVKMYPNYAHYKMSVDSYSGGMCQIIAKGSKESTLGYEMYFFPDGSKSTLSVARKVQEYNKLDELYSATLTGDKNINYKTTDAGLSMKLCMTSMNNKQVKENVDYDLIQFTTNCILPSKIVFHPIYTGTTDGCLRFSTELPIINSKLCSVRAFSHYYNIDTELDLRISDLTGAEIFFIISSVMTAVLLAVWVALVIGCQGKPISECLSCAKCIYADYAEVDPSEASDFGSSMMPSDKSSSITGDN